LRESDMEFLWFSKAPDDTFVRTERLRSAWDEDRRETTLH
jgi:hypothetical protein